MRKLVSTPTHPVQANGSTDDNTNYHLVISESIIQEEQQMKNKALILRSFTPEFSSGIGEGGKESHLFSSSILEPFGAI